MPNTRLSGPVSETPTNRLEVGVQIVDDAVVVIHVLAVLVDLVRLVVVGVVPRYRTGGNATPSNGPLISCDGPEDAPEDAVVRAVSVV